MCTYIYIYMYTHVCVYYINIYIYIRTYIGVRGEAGAAAVGAWPLAAGPRADPVRERDRLSLAVTITTLNKLFYSSNSWITITTINNMFASSITPSPDPVRERDWLSVAIRSGGTTCLKLLV